VTRQTLVLISCDPVAPPPPEGTPRLVVNEIDYDQVGADTGGFVEIAKGEIRAATIGGATFDLVEGTAVAATRRAKAVSPCPAPGGWLAWPC